MSNLKINCLDRTTIFKISGILIIVFSCVLALISKPIIFVDDAWITFRYAHNLAFNGQLTFNLNERVEGITNALWAIILAVQLRFFSMPIVVVALYTSLFFTVFSLYLIWKIGLLLKINPLVAAIPPCILILNLDFYGTAVNGLEASLFTFLLVEAVYWFLKEKLLISSLCFSLLFLTRPESIVLGFIFFGLLLQPSILLESGRKLTFQFLGFQTKEKRFEIVKCTAVFLGIVAATTWVRVWYYHDFIPNSVRAKMVPYDLSLAKAGLEYAINFSKYNPYFVLILIVSLIYLLVKTWHIFFQTTEHRFEKPNFSYQLMAFCFISIVFSFVIVLRSGGDWMPNHRLLSQYSIMYLILLIVLVKESAVFYKIAVIVLLVFLTFSLVQVLDLVGNRIKSNYPLVDLHHTPGFSFWDETADRLSRSPLNSSDVVSAEGIGYISYSLPGVYMHDPMGLTQKHIARFGKSNSPFGKKDIKYTVMKIKPSVMVWQYVGHLRNLDQGVLDNEYVTYCQGYCNNWRDADIVMIRKDRAKDLSPYFNDWELITISSLFKKE